ncbi:MAG: response regulator [Betaproteobacteria bacterium]|nr:response regulator [Betaproteobacteria bacterium]
MTPETGRQRTLLLVDDEPNIISALVRVLRPDGYRILRAQSGREGLALLARDDVGVILSDQRMPEMTGVEFLSEVKDRFPDTVRLVLSGYTDLNSITDAINRGAIYRFLTKPWEDDLLRENVREAFHRHEIQLENLRLTAELRDANAALLRANQELEQRVEDKTREITRNMSILRISQEVLDHLPLAVIGIGDDGLIAIANHEAHALFADRATRSLLGEPAQEALPGELLRRALTCRSAPEEGGPAVRLDDGRTLRCWCHRLSALSHAKGLVLVLAPHAHPS